MCIAGSFGQNCEYSIRTIYHEHDVYANSSALPQEARLQGWSPPCGVYDKITANYNIEFIVEVGVWKGLSAICLADALRRRGRGALLAVDTWLGALEFWSRSQTHGRVDSTRNLHLKHGYPHVYEHFLANVVRAQLQRFVIPFPVPSRLASNFLAQLPRAHADLVHIDAAHEYGDAVEDIRVWWARLRPGGIMLGDDFQAAWPGVVRAACEHAASVGVQLFRPAATSELGTYAEKKWWLRKPHPNHKMNPVRRCDAWLRACMSVTTRGWRKSKTESGTLVVKSDCGR